MGEWRRVRIGDVARQRKGSTTISDETEYKLCRVQLHRKGVVLREKLPGAAIKTKKQQVCKAGDLVVAEMDAKFGGYGFIGDELDGAIVSSHYYLYELEPAKISKEYFHVLIHSGTIQNQIEAKGSTNYSSIRGWEFLDYDIPLPSLGIQAQIASRFNTCFAAVNNHDLQASEQLSLLKQLRQAVLQEAVEGKLTADWRKRNLPPFQGEGRGGDGVKGDPNYDAAALLVQIKAEKERLVKAGKSRKEKPLPPIDESDKPFELPAGWVWCRLGEVVESTEAGTSYLCKESEAYGTFWGVIKTSAITSGQFLESENKLFSERPPRDCSKQIFLGDLLFCRASGSKGLAGRCCVVRSISTNLLLSDKSIRIHPSKGISKDFIEFHNKSKTGISYFETLSTQKSTSMNNVTREDLLAMPFPLPPLAEQQAIVARVDSLMAMIDELEQQVTERKEQAQMLMQAVLREAFAGGEGAEASDFLPLQGGGQEGDGTEHRQPLRGRPIPTPTLPLKGRERSCVRNSGEGEDLPLVAETPSGYTIGGQAALPAASQPVSGGIPARILAAMQHGFEYSRADILSATSISETDWVWALRQLKEQGRVVQKGERRGARYVLK